MTLGSFSFLISLLAAGTSIGAAVLAHRSRKRAETSRATLHKLVTQYGEAVAIIGLIAKRDPPCAADGIRDLCAQHLERYGITVNMQPDVGRDVSRVH